MDARLIMTSDLAADMMMVVFTKTLLRMTTTEIAEQLLVAQRAKCGLAQISVQFTHPGFVMIE